MSPAASPAAPAWQPLESSYHWQPPGAGRPIRVLVSRQGGNGPAWLLLPALSTISSRHEWQPLITALAARFGSHADAPALISVDWPGFGDSERRRLAYDAPLLARFLHDLRHDCAPSDCALVAAGHAAGIALLAEQRHGLPMREWLLVAPTWRGPLPTMARRRSRLFPLLRSLVELPLLGPPLYWLNTCRPLLAAMSRRHVDVAGAGLMPEGLAQRQRVARRSGARFASAAFVTGGLDPFDHPDDWLRAARLLASPLTVVIADQAPPRSLAQMRALAACADRQGQLPGRLGAHQECGEELATWLL
ncbi:MAG: alpha/beta hydrolase [Synechococcaceae cyanobacterium]|nr:alpha/beta hydrolase [Synechococcaceae cyanobacterium]